jgi:beta-N-acetylhexosaminidase
MRLAPRAAGILCALVLTACSGGGGSGSPTATGTSPTPPRTNGVPSPTASPTAASTASSTAASTAPSAVDAAFDRLDERGRVAQLMVVGVPLSGLGAADALVRQGVGGIFLHGRSTAAATALGATTSGWSAEAPGPRPWVAADQEGGQVQTLKGPGFGALPSALAQGRLPLDQLAGLADGMGAGLQTAGVTLDLAPVADVVPAGTEAGNAPIGAFDRQYGSTAAQVGPAARTVVDRLAAHRVVSSLKHFPGLGRVRGNTDTTAGVTDPTATAGDEQVALFGSLATDPAHPMVMVSLATYPQLDPSGPAAFSSAVVTGLLRGRLGFTGPVISDDLANAKSAQVLPAGERAVRFLAAGGTLVLTVEPSLAPAMIDAVVARAAADPAFSAQVDTAVRTALTAKARAGLLAT